MITTTIMRRVLAKLEASLPWAADPRDLQDVSARHALRIFQADGDLIAAIVDMLNAETRTLADFRNMPADAKPRALGAGASATACDDQHTTARRL